ncbi:MAG TPA: sensor histidine kinase [Steroidobacteraceae bacterium]|nr:sensor histidine kinase [Steroidobacteraceae bacterium]
MSAQRRSIATIVSISLVVATTTVLVAFAALNFWENYRAARTRFRLNTDYAAAQLAVSLRSAAWNFDQDQIESLMASAMQDGNIRAVVVDLKGEHNKRYVRARDAAGQSVGAAALPAVGGDIFFAQQTIRAGPLPRGGSASEAADELGQVMLYTTFSIQRRQIERGFLLTLVAIAVSDALLIATLYFLAWWLVLRPLQTLRGHAMAVAGGADERDGLADLRFRGEFEDLRSSLVAMLQLLQLRYQDLQQQQQRYRVLVADMLRVQDTERRQIGRELHDSVGQILAALEINLDLLQRRGLHSDAESARLLEEAAALARQCRSEIRTTSYLLHPPLLEELGLATALEWLADGFRERSQIALSIAVPAQMDRLPDEVELALFRVAQEALSNVYRHSEAKSAAITLSCDAETIALQISDTGKGFDLTGSGSRAVLSPGQVRHGVGLAGMRERMQQIGGELEVHSGMGGTTVTATLRR